MSLLFVLLTLLTAFGQAVSPDEPAPINAQHYRPSVDGQMTLWVDDAGHADAALGTIRVVGGYAYRPLMFVQPASDDLIAQLEHMGSLDIMGGLNLGPIRIGAHIPLFVTSGEVTPTEAGIGDVALDVRASFFKSTRNTMGLALGGRVWAPTATLRSSVGHRNWAGEATVIFDASVGPLLIAGNLGYKIVPRVDLGNVVWDDQVILRAGAGVAITERVGLSGEIASSLSVQGPFGENRASPAEFLLGFWHDAGKRVIIRGAAGTQMSGGVGAPNLRALVSLSWEPRKIRDTDGDGYKDPEDGCPEEPEDFDEFRDEDGCPDPYVNVSFKVVNPDGVPIDDAWIDLYVDGEDDADPVHPGFVWQLHPGRLEFDVRANNYKPVDGSFMIPEDTESYVHEVVLESMAVGSLKVTVVDGENTPVDEATWSVGGNKPLPRMQSGIGETELISGEYTVEVRADGFAPTRVPVLIAEAELTELLVILEPSDGALGGLKLIVTDPDGGLVPDTIWSVGDQSMPPLVGGVGEVDLAAGDYSVVVEADSYTPVRVPTEIVGGEITELKVILEPMDVNYLWLYKRVYFATNSAVGLPSSKKVLDEVAQTLRDHPEIDAISIEGHTDTQGGESFNQRLSDRRSAWVAAELSRRGVAKSRMITKAFGESAPADDKGDEHPWANNRRVEIRIAETNR